MINIFLSYILILPHHQFEGIFFSNTCFSHINHATCYFAITNYTTKPYYLLLCNYKLHAFVENLSSVSSGDNSLTLIGNMETWAFIRENLPTYHLKVFWWIRGVSLTNQMWVVWVIVPHWLEIWRFEHS